jgi:hypothetical protein
MSKIIAKSVVDVHPTARSKEYARFDGNKWQYTYQIVDQHLNVLGKGTTPLKAWIDAANNLKP